MSDAAGGAATLSQLDPASLALVGLAAAIAAGEGGSLEAACREAVAAKVPAGWVDELLLQSVLMVGWPRALNGANSWRTISGVAPAPLDDDAGYDRVGAWRARGEAVCRTVYGPRYPRLRAAIGALHPALNAWMVVEGYGRTIGRPGLDLARRELCVVAQVAVQGAAPQLHSHLRGALHAGATPGAVRQALAAARPWLGPAEAAMAASLLDRIIA